MTDLLPSHPRTAAGAVTVVEPGTGELLELNAPAVDLVDALDRLGKLAEEAAAVRRLITTELAIRLDATGKRTGHVDGVKLKVNPPTDDHWTAEELERELREAGYAEQADAVIRRKPAVTPPPEVDKRAVKAFIDGPDRRLAGIVVRNRRRSATTRKVDVMARPVAGTARELKPGEETAD